MQGQISQPPPQRPDADRIHDSLQPDYNVSREKSNPLNTSLFSHQNSTTSPVVSQ
jgi:hypothetical protein